MNRASRIREEFLIFSKWAVGVTNRKQAPPPRKNLFMSSTIHFTRSLSRDRWVSSLIRSPARGIALSAGQRARNVTRRFPFSPGERTSR